MTSSDFMEVFLEFIFGDRIIISDESKIFDFQREFSKVSGSRPDFYFILDDKEYIIEVKIYDDGHHFVQYNEAFPNAELGYITNYYMGSQNGVTVKTWEGFYNHLISLKTYWQEDDKLLIEGYCEFLMSACNIIKIDYMKFESLNSLRDFNMALGKVLDIQEEEEDYSCKVYYKKSGHDNSCSGKYFELSYKDKFTVWGWMGIDYNDSKICIRFDNNDGWGKPIYQKLKEKFKNTSFIIPNTDISVIHEGDLFEFIMNREIFEQLNDPNEQVKYLRDSVNIVFNFLKFKNV